ncbi:MAG: hypothetical protein KA170_14750 [Candidatus Promineofilum sp.]|nr:hypothetical protein [Promineifilum sp.]
MKQPDVVTAELLDGLPEPVQRYMRWTGVVGQPWIRTAYVRQSGRFRQGFDKPWMPMAAEQVFTIDPPGMVWQARFKMFGLPLMRARDTYQDGRGHMFGKAAGLFTIFDERGEELTQGTLTRFLSEMIWFPIAYLGDNITWTAVDDGSADVTLSDHGRTASGRMFFDDLGRPTTFETMRYMGIAGGYRLTPWHTPHMEWDKRDGLNIPVRGEVSWGLPEGMLTYGDFHIDAVAYNRPGDAL